ncbi:DUF5906 domain-containing protein [Marichromatium purpuratum]|uniref:DUF5906 domain-containing protein n=1 Tax=Marichromatium purpuratum TaxID=37487 RepID=UPI0002D8D5EB|nr:DUF5906 domain-containing protein [Marichromatium purpuratum]
MRSQLLSAGLTGDRVEQLEVGKIIRTQVEDDREKRGWYLLHEIQNRNGESVLVGSYGIWRGNDNGARKIELGEHGKLSDEEREALKAKYRDDRKRAAAVRARDAERAARRAEQMWRKCEATAPEGGAEYLTRKGIGGHGVRYTQRGSVVIPMHDANGRVYGLQFLLSRTLQSERIQRTGRDKEYWPAGVAKQGHWHQIGAVGTLVLVCEGYATGASLHEATQFPVAVAFDAGNLRHVARALRKAYPRTRILICADDDFATQGNPGTTAASAAALECSGSWVAPRFSVDDQVRARARIAAEVDWSGCADDARAVARAIVRDAGRKLTDYNDLHAAEGLLTVRSQIEARLTELGWTTEQRSPTTTPGGEGRSVEDWRFDIEILINEYALIYGTDTVFDHRRKLILGLGPLRSAAGKGLVRQWLEHPDRQTVLQEQVGFDPGESDSQIRCNLWAGWPSRPESGSCERLLELLEYLCSGETQDPHGLYQWILKWIAYPIQHPGAKMQTALLVHGPEGTGKNTFFGCVRRIYGRYACQFSQVELESNFNGWASGKLFAIGNEVVSRAELYHIQGRLKAMVTEPEWIINEKMLPARSEANHCNLVFFSNRIDIAKLDDGDRRYCVVWTPQALPEHFYLEVSEEIANGGTEALHHHLLHLDLGDFSPHTKPPMTHAKRDLVELGMDSTERFYRDWSSGEIDPDLYRPCTSHDLYDLYRLWTRREGIPKAAQKQTLLTAIGKKPTIRKADERYLIGHNTKRGMVVFPTDRPMPDGVHRQQWIGNQIEAFRAAMTEARRSLGELEAA